jgi:hypothetical protein
MGDMAESITISKNSKPEFPYIRVPKFELLGSQTRSIIGNDLILWAPFVSEDQKIMWAEFSKNEQGWYNESLSILKSDPSVDLRRFVAGSEFRDYIWEGDDLVSGEAVYTHGPFAPLWQISPPTSSLMSINYNILHETYINTMLPVFKQTRDYLLSSAILLSDNGLSKSIIDSQGLNIEDATDRPYTIHFTPVHEKLDDTSSALVGILLSTIIWDEYLESLFHADETGIVLILRNNCEQSFTFALQEGKVRFFSFHGCLKSTSKVNTNVIYNSKIALTRLLFLAQVIYMIGL